MRMMNPRRLRSVTISNGEIPERGSFVGLGGVRSPRTYLTANSDGEIAERTLFVGLGGVRSPRTYLSDNMVVSRRILKISDSTW